MSLSNHLSQLAGALDQTRTKIGETQVRLDALRRERNVIALAKPHADDITDSLMRAIDSQARAFETDLKKSLHSRFVKSDDAAEAVTRMPVNVMSVEAPLDPFQLEARRAKGLSAPINMGALVFLLRDRLADEVPALVDRLCPEASSGMRSAERRERLQGLDTQIAALEAELHSLNEELIAARRLVSGAGVQ